MEKVVNGKKVYYADIKSVTTVVRFSLLQRIKILFGYKLRVFNRIYTDRRTEVVHTEGRTDLLTVKQLIEKSMKKAVSKINTENKKS